MVGSANTPLLMSADPETSKLIAHQAGKRGMSVQAYLRELVTGSEVGGGQNGNGRKNMTEENHSNGNKNGFIERLREQQQQMLELQVARAMIPGYGESVGQKSLTADDIRKIIAEELRSRQGDTAPKSAIDRLKEGYAQRAELKMLKDMAEGEHDAPAVKFWEQQAKAQEERMKGLENESRLSREMVVKIQTDAQQAAQQAQIEKLQETVAGYAQQVNQLLTNPPRGQGQTDELGLDAFSKLISVKNKIDEFEKAFGRGAPLPSDADWTQRIGQLAKDVASGFSEAMGGVGAALAGKHGVHPSQIGAMPGQPGQPFQPEYSNQGSPLPSQPKTLDEVRALIPDNAVLNDEYGRQVGKEEFIQRYGQKMIENPGAFSFQQHAGPPPLPPPPEVVVPDTPPQAPPPLAPTPQAQPVPPAMTPTFSQVETPTPPELVPEPQTQVADISEAVDHSTHGHTSHEEEPPEEKARAPPKKAVPTPKKKGEKVAIGKDGRRKK